MTAALVFFLLVLSAICPAGARAQVASGCGLDNIGFDVKTENRPQPAPTPQPGKALVFFLQDDMKQGASQHATTRFGIDGAWVGATRANSYFYVTVNPGEHDVCASWRLHTFLAYFGPKGATDAAHFMAETGERYYFRAQDITFDRAGKLWPEIKLERLDSDEANILIRSLAFSSSRHKN